MISTVPFADLGAMTREIRVDVEAAWSDLLDSCRFIGGSAVERFEDEWASYCGTTHAIGVANGTDALYLTLRALGLGRHDEVVVPANTFVATVEAVVLAGAIPRFADVSPRTLLLTGDTLEAAISDRTRAVIAVHLFGQTVDMDEISRVAAVNNLDVIEDAAQAHGATWHGRRAGSMGHAGCFSFYPGKNLGAFGDAGAVVTSDDALAARIRCLRDHGRVSGSHYQHALAGVNSRLDALQAAVLRAKLSRLGGWTQARRSIADRYAASFAGGPVEMVQALPGARAVYHLAVVSVEHRDLVRRRLESMGVQTGIHYPTPCHQLPPYLHYATGPLPVVERAAERIMSLPMFPHMAESQVTYVCDALHAAVGVEAVHSA